MPKRVDMVGERYGRLIVRADRDEEGNLFGTPSSRRVEVECDCGNRKVLNARSIRRGHTRSCGCLQPETARKHGLDSHPLAQVWRAMKSRCYSEKSDMYPRYGGRGIGVCAEWRHDLRAFVGWAEKNGWREGLQIDRIDNDKDYTPENCRFVTCKQNSNNKSSNRTIVVRGEKLTVAQAADKYNIPYNKLYQRIVKLGWDADMAVDQEVAHG